MLASPRPRRSVLYMPGSNPRALEKARSLAADGFIFDLEDAVAPDAKAAARDTVARALAAGGYGGREVMLRVNAPTTVWGAADLVAAAAMPIDAVLLPKVEDARYRASGRGRTCPGRCIGADWPYGAWWRRLSAFCMPSGSRRRAVVLPGW